ncbi:MAG TPA: methylene-tetrahydromethanopterin dehydrogenase N-terminal domain-containing protein [Vicinamibacteria bacterium]|nr:methylene-tetrahydromethanopterin dehydrogenase N-terminal domain-containing protein [Vicinamibacteria bacterium]
MRRVLLQLDPDRHPSAFDRIVALDAGAEEVLSYGAVEGPDVQALVHGAIFTRGPKELRNSALFVGGSRLADAESLLAAAKAAFFGPFRVSILFDPNGCNTTAAAAVLKLVRAAGGDVRGKRAVVLAGTGPVGARAAGLLARLGAQVRITSRDAARGASVADRIGARFGGHVEPVTARAPAEAGDVLADVELALAAGPAGVALAPRQAWAGRAGLVAVADANAVPPAGVEGVEAPDDGALRDGVATFGALGIGGLKMKAHRAAVARLFERNDLVLDAEEIYDLTAAL